MKGRSIMGFRACFLLICESEEGYWHAVYSEALGQFGLVRAVTAAELGDAMCERYDLVILDAAVDNIAPLIRRLQMEHGVKRVIVITASPTWKRAREAFQAGAVDYVQKSLDHDEIRAVVLAALEKPLSRSP
jgi:DNA-binding response OmpR family regulator